MTAISTIPLNRAQMRGFSIVPMLTPFRADGSLDEAAAARLVEHIIGGGSQGLLAAGTTGEAVSMPVSMRVRLVEIAVETTRGRGVVFGGIGDNCIAASADGILAAQARLDAISAVYQKGRTVSQSLCAMKAVLEILGFAERHMLPPLLASTDAEIAELRERLRETGLLQ